MKSLFLVLIVVAITGCQRNETQNIMLTGSSTVAPLAREIGRRFEAKHPGVRVDVQMGGSSRGLADARKGLADIGMVSRELKPSESDVIGHKIALDGIAIITHKENPISNLTKDQVQKIYRGKIANWRELGGTDAKITVVNKAEGRSTLELFTKHFEISNREIKADVVIGDNEQGIQTVSGNPSAIGYVSVGTAEYDASKGIPIKLIDLDGVTSARKTVRDGTFPLARPLTLVTKTEPIGLTKQFIDFAKSDQVHDLVERQFFVPLGP